MTRTSIVRSKQVSHRWCPLDLTRIQSSGRKVREVSNEEPPLVSSELVYRRNPQVGPQHWLASDSSFIWFL